MVARVAVSSTANHGQYVGTTRANSPSPSPGSPTLRSFNGTSDRVVLGRSNDLGSTFVAVMSVWRANTNVIANNQTAARFFTQYAVNGTRVCIGLNRSYLSVTYQDGAGLMTTVESKVQIADTARHVVALQVTSTEILAYLDGRLAIKVAAVLPGPDTARCLIGADAGSRFFQGYLDDFSAMPTAPNNLEHWLRYYRDLVLEAAPRDRLATGFAAGFDSIALSTDGYSATGSSDSARVPVSTAFRTEPELPIQYLEFTFNAGTGPLELGVTNPSHDLSIDPLGSTPNSYAYLSTGVLQLDGDAVAFTSTWSQDDLMALGWVSENRVLSLWKNGTKLHEFSLPENTWTAAVRPSGRTVQMNAGQAVNRVLPPHSPGLPIKAWSRLTTEFRHMKLAELAAPLDDSDSSLRDANTGTVRGSYLGTPATGASHTGDSFDKARFTGSGGIKVNSSSWTPADGSLFAGLAFKPTEADMDGTRVLLESPGKWGLRLINGAISAWIGGLEVTTNLETSAVEKDKLYYLALVHNGTTLMVWCNGTYPMAAEDPATNQTAGDVWVGGAVGGATPFLGPISHLVISGTIPPAWKLDRLKNAHAWAEPLWLGTGYGLNYGNDYGGPSPRRLLENESIRRLEDGAPRIMEV